MDTSAALATSPATGASPSEGDSTQGSEQGAGTAGQDKRVNGLMGLANRRLDQVQRAEAERDATRAELDALRASIDQQWDEQRDAYLQREPGGVDPAAGVADGEQGAGDADADVGVGEDREPEPVGLEFPSGDFVPELPAQHASGQPVVAGTNPRRGAPVTFGRESSLAETRAVFRRMAEAEDMRIREDLARR